MRFGSKLFCRSVHVHMPGDQGVFLASKWVPRSLRSFTLYISHLNLQSEGKRTRQQFIAVGTVGTHRPWCRPIRQGSGLSLKKVLKVLVGLLSFSLSWQPDWDTELIHWNSLPLGGMSFWRKLLTKSHKLVRSVTASSCLVTRWYCSNPPWSKWEQGTEGDLREPKHAEAN